MRGIDTTNLHVQIAISHRGGWSSLLMASDSYRCHAGRCAWIRHVMTSIWQNCDLHSTLSRLFRQELQLGIMTLQVKDKDGKAIKEGETVSGKIRGGKHVGEVNQVVTSKKKPLKRESKIHLKFYSQINMVLSSLSRLLTLGHHVQRNLESLVQGSDPK